MKVIKDTSPILVLATIIFLSCIVFAQNQQSSQPVVISAVAPVYPAAARAVRLQGDFLVNVKIDRNGKVISSKASKVTHPLMQKAIEEAANRWQFALDKDGGNEREVQLTFTFRKVPEASNLDSTTVFYPPYKIEVRDNTEIVDTPSY